MEAFKKTNKAVLSTLCYADIFSYPLTAQEIHRFLISNSKISQDFVNKALNSLKKNQLIESQNTYFFLKSRKGMVKLRISREKISQPKIMKAKKIAGFLKLITTVKAVAVTGALAMQNTDEDDDIDLLIITSNNRLWITRLLVVPLISLIAKRRIPTTNNQQLTTYKNTICLNLWLDESSLAVPIKQRNLYTAHEVAQTKFIWSRGDIDKQFLAQNNWITNYLPNVKIFKQSIIKNQKQKNPLFLIPDSLSFLFEFIAFYLQLWYMKKRRTREVISPQSAYFHPRNTSIIILKKYKKKIVIHTSQ